MTFKSKIEAYTYALLTLYRIREQIAVWNPSNKFMRNQHHKLNRCIQAIRREIENHQQNTQVITQYLEDLGCDLISNEHYECIQQLIKEIQKNAYQRTSVEKFENPLARRLESELAIIFVQEPTHAMMHAVGRMSEELLKYIDDLEQKGTLEPYLKHFTNKPYDALTFGAKGKPNANQLKALLEENNPAQFIRIMFIHYKFALAVSRFEPITTAPARNPKGKLEGILKRHYKGESKEFFSKGLSHPRNDITHRVLIPNNIFYNSELYTAGNGKRGRKNKYIHGEKGLQMGLMLRGQEEHEINLPQYPSPWNQVCKNQEPDYDSQYVIDSIDNDTVYVAGPSGMASLLLGQMENLGNFEKEHLKKNYLTAIACYIVAGGLHSWHEVLGPAAYCLDLIPGYKVQPPQQDNLAPAPNYHHFFRQQAKLDGEFTLRRQKAWHRYLSYFNECYLPHHMESPYQPIPKALRMKIVHKLSQYIHCSTSHQHPGFIKRVMNNASLTEKKRALAKNLRKKIYKAHYSDVNDLKKALVETREHYIQAKIATGRNQCYLPKGQLAKCLDFIEQLISEYEINLANPLNKATTINESPVY